MKRLLIPLLPIFALFFGAFQAIATERERITPENIHRLTEIASTGRPTIDQVIWTPDNHIIAITGIGFYLYNADNLSLEPQFFPQHFAGRLNFILSSDGRYLVGFEDSFGSNESELRRDVWVWDIETGELAYSTEALFPDDTMPLDITGAMFFPDSSKLLLISVQGDLYEWNLDSPDTLTALTADIQGWDTRFATFIFSPDGQWLARLRNGVRIWDTSTWQIVTDIENLGFDGFNGEITFNQDGTQALLSTPSQTSNTIEASTLHLINLPSGEVVFEQNFARSIPAFDDQDNPIAMVSERAADGQIQGKIQLVDLQTGQIRWQRSGEGFFDGKFDSQTTVFVGRIGDPWELDLWIWDVATGDVLLNHQFPHDVDFDLSSDSSRLAIISGFSGDSQNWRSRDSRLQIWDLTTSELVSENIDHSHIIIDPHFSPNSRYLAIGGNDEMRLWDTATWEFSTVEATVNLIAPRLRYYPLGYADNSRILLGTRSSSNGTVIPMMWQTDDGAILSNPIQDTNYSQLDSNGGLLAVVSYPFDDVRADITLYEYPSLQQISRIDIYRPVEQSYFSPDSSLIAAFTRDGWLGVWDVQTGEEIFFVQTQTDGNWSTNNRLQIDPHNRWLMNWQGTTELWNIETGDYWGDAYALQFSPDGSIFAAVKPDDFTLRFYDGNTGDRLEDHFALENVSDFAFSPDGQIIAVETHTDIQSGYLPLGQQVSLYDMATEALLLTLNDYPTAFNPIFSPDGTLLAVQTSGRRLIAYGIK